MEVCNSANNCSIISRRTHVNCIINAEKHHCVYCTQNSDSLHPGRTYGTHTMTEDPIIEEVRRVRHEYAARFNHDIRAMAKDLKKREQEHPERLVSFQAKAPRKQQTGSMVASENTSKPMEW